MSQFQIRHASVDRLLDRLTDLRFLSIDFLNTFLLTYRVFTTGQTVLEALRRVYRNPEYGNLEAGPASNIHMEQEVLHRYASIWLLKVFYSFYQYSCAIRVQRFDNHVLLLISSNMWSSWTHTQLKCETFPIRNALKEFNNLNVEYCSS